MFIEPIGDNIILQLPMEERKDEVTILSPLKIVLTGGIF